MKRECPKCKETTARRKERRFLHGKFNDVYATAHSILDLWVCKAKKTCGHKHLIRTDVPLDATLSPKQYPTDNWAAWNKAQKSKPGKCSIGPVVGKFTDDIHHDPASQVVSVKHGNGWRIVNRLMDTHFTDKPHKEAARA